ncbi:hypothetical protein D3C76_550630 [compost metagenome]
MNKFENFNVNGGNNQLGNNNTQNNVTNNNHHHHNNENKGGGEETIPIAIGAVVGLAALIWWFFSHIDQVYFYLNIIIISSPGLSLLAASVLLITSNITQDDIFRFLGCIFYALGLLGLAMLARNHAPSDVIQLSEQVKFMEFWRGLESHEKNLVLANFLSTISIGIAALVVHLGSIRQLAYALAKPSRTGFFYELYSITTPFRMRFISAVIAILSGLVWAAMNGKLPGINA